MKRLILLAFAVCCSHGSATNADEYLLRIDTIGCVDNPAANQDAKDTIIRSIEVVAHPGSTFHSKVNTGTQALVVTGKLRTADDGGFEVQIRYVYSIDTGTTVPTTDGGRKSIDDTTAIQTNLTIDVGDSVTLGGLESKVTESGKPERHSKTRYVLVLTKYASSCD